MSSRREETWRNASVRSMLQSKKHSIQLKISSADIKTNTVIEDTLESSKGTEEPFEPTEDRSRASIATEER